MANNIHYGLTANWQGGERVSGGGLGEREQEEGIGVVVVVAVLQ